MYKTKILSGIGVTALLLLNAVPVFAHSVVTPNQVGVAKTQNFTLSVPTEKDNASTTSIKLLIPAGLSFVTPVIEPGWKIDVKSGPIPSGMTPPKAADGDMATSIPVEIDWTSGSIPSGQKAIFEFSAQAPAQAGELDWKVYQGYSDGSTVSWDLGPNDSQPKDDKGNPTFDTKGPYSKTMVVNDLTSSSPDQGMGMSNQSSNGNTGSSTATQSPSSNGPLVVALLSLLLSAVSLAMHFRNK